MITPEDGESDQTSSEPSIHELMDRLQTVLAVEAPSTFLDLLKPFEGELLITVCCTLLCRLRCDQDASLVMQDVRHTVFRAFSGKPPQKTKIDFADTDDFAAWLNVVARSRAIDYVRRVVRDRKVFAHCPDLDLDETGTSGQWPGHELAQKEQIELVRQALEDMPKHLRDPLTMFEYDEMSYHEIAEKLNEPRTTIRGRIAQGRRFLLKNPSFRKAARERSSLLVSPSV